MIESYITKQGYLTPSSSKANNTVQMFPLKFFKFFTFQSPFFLINYYFARSTQSTFFPFHTIATKNIYIMNLSLKSQSALATSQSPCTAQFHHDSC